MSVLLLPLLLAGCASSPKPRLYLLENRWPVESQSFTRKVRVLPFRLSSLLDRPQIVSVISDREIIADEFNRWAVPLDKAAVSRFGSSLAEYLPDAYVDIQPWRDEKDADFFVQANIMRLDGALGEYAELVAQWKVFGPNPAAAPLVQKTARYRREIAGKDHASYVSALGLVLDDMAKEIAGFISGQCKSEKQ